MKKFDNMSFGDQLQAILLTKIQEYSLRFQYISNCDKITYLLEVIFSKSSKAHLKLFTGYDLDILLERFLCVPVDVQMNLAKKILMPFFKRNAAICMKETSRYTGDRFRPDLITTGGIVLMTKSLLKCSEHDAIEYLKTISVRRADGHGKTP